ncbi:hypothetical protein ACIA5D_36525 [Actinoplanes sp. NPDC051513]|uniref:hypothetical protein n=1 Tax=Actinoplanes sp. NPDC051513 TaxID=3363908 RepID=UPI0037ADCBD1
MDPGVVLDTSALVEYARNDVRALPIDELLRELREDTGGPVHIPWYALEEAQQVLADDRAALARLESFAGAHGVRLADADTTRAVDLIVEEGRVTPGLAHAMLLSVTGGLSLATYAAPTLEQAGFSLGRVLDLDEVFREE